MSHHDRWRTGYIFDDVTDCQNYDVTLRIGGARALRTCGMRERERSPKQPALLIASEARHARIRKVLELQGKETAARHSNPI